MNRCSNEIFQFTWNPVVGCKRKCPYCAAWADYKKPFPEARWEDPVFIADRLETPKFRKKPANVLVCSVGDLFGDWVAEDKIQKVVDVIRHCRQHWFFLLTKNPKRYLNFEFPKNVWLGSTIEDASLLDERASSLLSSDCKGHRWISYEPLLSDMPYIPEVDWIVIGSPRNPMAPFPDRIWIKNIVTKASGMGIPVYLKNSIFWETELKQLPEPIFKQEPKS